VNADAVKLADGSTPNVYTGRYDYVMKDLMSITNGGTLGNFLFMFDPHPPIHHVLCIVNLHLQSISLTSCVHFVQLSQTNIYSMRLILD